VDKLSNWLMNYYNNIMKELFFDKIDLPDFLLKYFDNEEWYLIIKDLRNIIENNIDLVNLSNVPETVKIYNKVYIGTNCKIADNVVIEGPVYIGDNVEIGPGAYIRPGSVVGDNCVVGHAAEIKNAVMMQGSKVSNHSFVGDSILGMKARVGGHCESTNRRFDQGSIILNIQDKMIDTQLDKFGMILGEGARLGGSVMVSPGTAVGKKTFVSTGLVIGGYIAPNKFLKFKSNIEVIDNIFTGELHNKSKLFE
jgi:UDP-N-acetylglucosamine diphosphorylase / glucose-1-phosphate thymidylyltransferase / UDP-N-acetylgalactosamine diphosphorylase / glucosamine-1-phosphate N-acetyltransferase / galactosamine-1-phosphate N-acetyltransferase